MARLKNNYQFWYKGNIIETRYCSLREIDLICKNLEVSNELEKGSVDYKLLMEN
jgi:hypothetical protein